MSVDKVRSPAEMYDGMRVVACHMEKGGTGKTTLSLHLAIRAAFGHIPEVKKKVLLIDVDEQQNSSKTLLKMDSVEGEGYSLPPIHPDFDDSDPDDIEWGGRSNSVDLYYGNPVMPYPSELSNNLHILPSDGMVLKGFEDIKNTPDKGLLESIYEQMYRFFADEDVKAEYDLVVIDCPPGKTLITTPVLRAATDIILPAQPEAFGMEGIHRMIYEIKKENKHRPCDLNIIGIIPNQVDERLNIHKANIETLSEHPDTGPYLAPFYLKSLVNMKFEHLPSYRIDDCKLKDQNAEQQVQKFVNYVREKMYQPRISKRLAS